MVKIYENKITGERGTDEYWEKKYSLRPGTIIRRAEKHGEDNPIILKSKKMYQAAVRKMNYDREEALGKKQHRVFKKLEAAGQLRLFGEES